MGWELAWARGCRWWRRAPRGAANWRRERSRRQANCPLARHIHQQAVILRLCNLVALTRVLLKALTVKYSDVAAAVLDQAFVLQLAGGGGDAFAAHAQHD